MSNYIFVLIFKGVPILAGAVLIFYLVGYWRNRRNKVLVYHGWPANSLTWMDLFYNRKTGEFTYTRDSLFADDKPSQYSFESFCMIPGRNATLEEVKLAQQALRKYNLL